MDTKISIGNVKAGVGVVFDFLELYKQATGKTPYVLPGFPEDALKINPYKIEPTTKKTTTFQGIPLYGGSDVMGREVFLPITIIAGNVKYEFPFAVLGISGGKKWVETETTEMAGEVNELIGLKSYQIRMKGFFIGQYGQFPDDQIEAFRKVFETNPTVRLHCAYTDIFLKTSDEVIIKDFDIPEKSGVIGVREFSLNMKTDTVFNLYINN